MRIDEWKRLLPPEAVFVGATAARLHGLDLPRDYVEVAVPPTRGNRSRRGLMVRHLVFLPGDVVTVRDTRVTTLLRTLRDICVLESRVEALVALDMALYLRRTSKPAVRAYIAGVPGQRGTRRLRRLIELAEPAESAMETRLRWLLIRGRRPRPEVQPQLYDAKGNFVGRADLFYRTSRLVVEFDGGNHRDRLVGDDGRQNLLMKAGYRILRFTASDVYQRAEVVEAQVRAALVA